MGALAVGYIVGDVGKGDDLAILVVERSAGDISYVYSTVPLDEAELVRFDPSLGIAVLRTGSMIQPNAVAHFRDGMPRLNSEIAVAGYSFGGILPSAAMTFGHLSSLRGLNDEDTLFRLAISTFEGDIGGPVVDESGGVIGMLVPLDTGDRLLPDNVGFALNKEAIQKVLEAGTH